MLKFSSVVLYGSLLIVLAGCGTGAPTNAPPSLPSPGALPTLPLDFPSPQNLGLNGGLVEPNWTPGEFSTQDFANGPKARVTCYNDYLEEGKRIFIQAEAYPEPGYTQQTFVVVYHLYKWTTSGWIYYTPTPTAESTWADYRDAYEIGTAPSYYGKYDLTIDPEIVVEPGYYIVKAYFFWLNGAGTYSKTDVVYGSTWQHFSPTSWGGSATGGPWCELV